MNDRFKLDWGTYLTTSEDIIYALIDGRGSGFKVITIEENVIGAPKMQNNYDAF